MRAGPAAPPLPPLPGAGGCSPRLTLGQQRGADGDEHDQEGVGEHGAHGGAAAPEPAPPPPTRNCSRHPEAAGPRCLATPGSGHRRFRPAAGEAAGRVRGGECAAVAALIG